MAFGPIDTTGVPAINNYGEAKRIFERIPPWRGCGEHERPIAKRRDKHKMIVRLNNDDIACRLYNTDVVTYHKDDTISIRRYDTASTVEFANAVLPWELQTTMHLGQMWVRMETVPRPQQWPYDDGKVRHYLREGKERLRFKRMVAPTGSLMAFECLNPEAHDPAKRLLLDKERARQTREMLRPFEQWAQALLGINNGRPPQDTRNYVTVRSLMSGELEVEDYVYLLNRYTQHSWRHQARVMMPGWINKLRDDAYRHLHAFTEDVVPITELPTRSKWGIR